MEWFIGAVIIILSLALLYVLICTALGLFVIKSSLMPERIAPEVTIKKDTDNGCSECFDDYFNKWDRHDFTVETFKATIKGEYILNPENDTGRKKVAIICHGHTVSRFACLKYARMFYQLGYNLIIFDERYFGQSKARNCTLGMYESQDVKQLMQYARELFGKDCYIVLHGESMGAATALLTLGIEKPELVVADCPFADPYLLMKYLAGKRISIIPTDHILLAARLFSIWLFDYDMRKVRPMDTVSESDVPICLIHGACDTYVPCEHSQMMYKLMRNPDSELHLVAGAGHARSYAIDLDYYIDTLNAFVRKIEARTL